MGRREHRPDITPEAREARMVSLAMDLAEKQLRDGTAPASTVAHYLKLGSSRERLEQLKIEYETELIEARKEALSTAARLEELYTSAMEAMQRYRGATYVEDEDP